MGNDEMTADTPREAQPPSTEAQSVAGVPQRPSPASVDEPTMAIPVSDLFDDDE